MPTGVIFDVDGTLIDSVDLHAKAWQDAFREFGFDLPFDRVRSQIGKGSDQLIPALLPPDAAKAHGRAIDEFRGEHFKKEYMARIKPFSRVRELFERVRKDGTPVALASSAKGDELDHYKELTNIGDLIDAATSSSDADKSKPHPDIFLAALERLGDIDRAGGVVVGDTPYDAEAAGKAGVKTVGVTCGGWPAEELTAAGCVAVYRDPADLLANFDRSPLSTGRPAAGG